MGLSKEHVLSLPDKNISDFIFQISNISMPGFDPFET